MAAFTFPSRHCLRSSASSSTDIKPPYLFVISSLQSQQIIGCSSSNNGDAAEMNNWDFL
jgi:hypothetical protein